MAHAVLKIKGPIDTETSTSRQFPFTTRYLDVMKRTIGDWTILYRPAQDNRKPSYIALAKVASIKRVAGRNNRCLATLTEVQLFDTEIPAIGSRGFYESSLRDRNWRSAVQRQVRHLPNEEFATILEDYLYPFGEQEEFMMDQFPSFDAGVRQRVRKEVSTIVRLSRLRRETGSAYNYRCCLTNSCLRDQNGNYEPQCSHWQPVWANGPDSVNNVSLVSSTLHWCIERGLISLADDYRILVRSDFDDPVMKMLNTDGFARMPDDANLRPDPAFLHYHRTNSFRARS